MQPALLIMAAGLGSRFGGVKQLAPIGPGGEIIMDYSVYDAVSAGFRKIIFVIRRDIEEDFRRIVGSRIEAAARRSGIEVCYAFQDLKDIPAALPEGRTRPWGTGHAVLSAKRHLDGPFAVINADDYYGRDAYRILADFLRTADGTDLGMAGFRLGNTLSDNGGVTRGICMTRDGFLTSVTETHGLVRSGGGAEANGAFYPADTVVSMNMWGLTPAYLPLLERDFRRFLAETPDPMNDEFPLPVHIGALLRSGSVRVKVLPTPDVWFGITHRKDAEAVSAAIRELVEKGVYPEALYENIK